MIDIGLFGGGGFFFLLFVGGKIDDCDGKIIYSIVVPADVTHSPRLPATEASSMPADIVDVHAQGGYEGVLCMFKPSYVGPNQDFRSTEGLKSPALQWVGV